MIFLFISIRLYGAFSLFPLFYFCFPFQLQEFSSYMGGGGPVHAPVVFAFYKKNDIICCGLIPLGLCIHVWISLFVIFG